MILAILQARVSSARLPNKVLRPILGQPMLSHQIARIKQSKRIDKLVLATSNEDSDKPLVTLASALHIESFQGSLNDVLSRFYHCAKQHQASHIVRLTGDCPLADAQIIDQVIDSHLSNHSDYSSNCHPATFADGFDVEVMTFAALEQAYQLAHEPEMREHVTLYLAKHNNLAKSNVTTCPDTSEFRVTVDNLADFELVEQIFLDMVKHKKEYHYQDIIDWLQANPKASRANRQYTRNETLPSCYK
ncbi:cytidylyltransferase domain-containing protein [Motilimonas sp. KMU-193]|uniref:cytidylyltransferase domain-containing protein n=1 Tax=Motilimonas sp. KMU-193 TaxID=3388668 RepID=UPI00396B258B